MRKILAISAIAALAIGGGSAQAAPPPGSWVTFGHDFQRTGHGDGTGNMQAAPTVAWTLPLGGLLGSQQALVAPVDGSGQSATVCVSGGRVVATRGDGTTLWSTALVGPTSVLGAWDLAGTGSLDIVVDTEGTGVLVLGGANGNVVTTLPTTAPVQAVFAQETTGGILVLAAYEGAVQGYDFRNGTAVNSPAWTVTGEDDPSNLVGDVDGDGVPDLVRPLNAGFEVDDRLTGHTKYSLPSMGPLAYFYLYELANVDGQPGQEIVAVDTSYFYSPDAGIYVVGVQGGALRTLWSSTATATAALGVDFFSVTGAIANLDGSSGLEIVYSQWNGSTWTTVIADAAAGTSLGTIPGAFMQAVADLDGDGKQEIVTRSGVQGNQSPARSTLTAYDFDSPQTGPVAKSWTIPLAHVEMQGLSQPPGPWPGLPVPVATNFDPSVPGVEFMVGVDQANANADTALLTIYGTSGSTAKSYAIPSTIQASVIAVSNDVTSGTSSNDVVLSRNDGTVHCLDSSLVEHADFSAGTYANWLRAVAGAAGTGNLFAATSNNHLWWIDGRQLHSDGTPYVRFDEPKVVPTGPSADVGDPADPVVFLSGASSTLVTFEQGASSVNIVAHSPSGAASWLSALTSGSSVAEPGAYALDLNGDGNDDLLLGIFNINGLESLTAYDGTNGMLLASVPITSILSNADEFTTGSLVDTNGDGKLDLVTPVDSVYGILSVNLFAQPYASIWLASQGTSPLTVNGTVGFSNVGDAGTPALLRSNGNDGVGPYDRLALDGGFVAELDQGFTQAGEDQNAAVMIANGSTASFDLVAAGTSGAALSRVRRVAGDTMTVAWTQYAANGAMSPSPPVQAFALHDPVAFDVDGNGVDDVVFGSDDGYLYAVSSTDGSLVFSVNLGAPVLHIVAANIDLDTKLEIVASLSNGSLVALDDSYDAARDMSDAGLDGSSDAGVGAVDASTDAPVDAALDAPVDSSLDAVAAPDAAEGGVPAGSSAGGGGCGCRVASADFPPYPALVGLAAFAGAVAARIRRRRKT